MFLFRFADRAIRSVLVCAVFMGGAVAANAQYYDPVDDTDPTTLRATLHDLIDDHTRFPYSDSTTDTWDILELADEDPADTGRVIDVYKNASYAKFGGGVGPYNREHTWPKSYGFPNDGDSNYPYTDCHHLLLSDVGYNADRSNKPFRWCDAGCTELTTDFNDGRGGTSGSYPAESNWTAGDFAQGTWETWDGRKGDVARAIFYMDIRYEGGLHGVTGFSEPDLRLTDDETLIDQSRTGSNEAVAYMGMLSVLLQWHQMDPPDTRELYRNEVVFTYQGNRNPFIDHPEWVDCLYQGTSCGGTGGTDTTPPAAPSGLGATAGTGSVDLAWAANTEPDLAGYDIYRSTTSGGPYTKINGPRVSATSYSDTGVTAGTTYYFVITAADLAGNISADSNQASATPTGGGGGGGGGGGAGSLILTEVVYDVAGTDDGWEWVELFNAGSTTIDLAGYSLGNGGTDYTFSTVQLSGSLAPGATFVVGGASTGAANASPSLDQATDFNPDFQNSGTTSDGVALFAVPASQITASTVPIDAVLYGSNNSNGLLDETGSAGAVDVGDVSSGWSIERLDLAGQWRAQSSPTPNTVPFSGSPTNTAPTVTITAPVDGSTATSGSSVTFSATASDTEDGDLSAAVVWTSDRDGTLGTGASFSSSSLSVGSHTITATVTDSGGLQATDSSSLGIEEPVGGTGSLILAEVLYDVAGGDDGFEWVELYNAGSAAIDLAGYSLGWGGTSFTTGTLQLAGVVPAGATFVVGGPTSSSVNADPSFGQVVNFNPDLENSGTAGDGVALFDVPASQIQGSTVPIDAVIYGPNNNNGLIDETGSVHAPDVFDVSSGVSIERLDLAGSWAAQSSPTPNSVPFGGPPPNTPPTVTVSLPSDGAVFTDGETVAFAATASDAEDGDLSTSISWASDRDGGLGTGASFSRTDLSVGVHVITATVTDTAAASDSDSVSIEVLAPAVDVTVVFTSIGAEDGWTRESSEGSSVGGSASANGAGSRPIRAGDDSKDRQWRSVLSFDTASLPDGATIVDATLRLRRGRLTGSNPFTAGFGACRVDVQTGGFGGSTALVASDYHAVATAPGAGVLTNATADGTWSEAVLDASGRAAIHLSGTTQVRIAFDLDDNDDGGNDYMGYFSGDHSSSSNHPQLVVTYRQ